jgi:hypothetical protein
MSAGVSERTGLLPAGGEPPTASRPWFCELALCIRLSGRLGLAGGAASLQFGSSGDARKLLLWSVRADHAAGGAIIALQ